MIREDVNKGETKQVHKKIKLSKLISILYKVLIPITLSNIVIIYYIYSSKQPI